VAFVVGVLLGFVGSIPAAGPLLVLVVASGLRRERSRALALACGGGLAESGYVLLAFGGLNRLFARHEEWLAPARGVSALFCIALGVWLLLQRPAETKPAAQRASGFVLGFFLVGSNPGFLIFWSTVATLLYSHGLRLQPGWLALGAFFGIVIWFAGVFALSNRLGQRFRPASLARAVRFLGAFLVVVGVFLGVRALGWS
jgi:threonine/homoserine/homoserine lactone efflux protein